MMAFLSQGGYAWYVWGAFGVTFALLLIEVLQLRAARRTILARVGRLARLRGAGPPPGQTAGPAPGPIAASTPAPTADPAPH